MTDIAVAISFQPHNSTAMGQHTDDGATPSTPDVSAAESNVTLDGIDAGRIVDFTVRFTPRTIPGNMHPGAAR